MFEYEPLKATGILVVAAVVSAMWMVRDKMIVGSGLQELVRRYKVVGRHRLA
jgi:hypothetical protein